MNPTPLPNMETKAPPPYRCIADFEEYQHAMVDFLRDASPHSATAARYGWPVDTWCFEPSWYEPNTAVDKESPPPPATVCQPTQARRCFTQHDELRQAVKEYARDSSPHSAVATRYGWPMGTWCVSDITDFSRIFKYSTLNEPLDDWDVSGARTMERMFYGARSFDQNLTTWNVTRVRNFSEMFAGAAAFDGDISTWDTSQAVTLHKMFDQAVAFHGNLSAWNVTRVTNMHGMFRGAVAFDGPDLGAWNTAKVSTMSRMFRGATAFTGTGLSQWNVGKVTKMDFMMEGATAFTESIADWDVSRVKTVRGMFLDATAFDVNLCSWGLKLPHKADARRMFEYATACPAWDVTPVVVNAAAAGPFCHVCPGGSSS